MSESTTKQSTSHVVLGTGTYVYEVVPEWGRLPNGVQFGYTHGVQVDSQTRVIVHNQSEDSAIFFDSQGTYIKSWGPEFQQGAHGCLLRKESGTEFLYLSDYARHVVVKTTLEGETVWKLTWPKESGLYKDESEFKPTNFAVSHSGESLRCRWLRSVVCPPIPRRSSMDPKLGRKRKWPGAAGLSARNLGGFAPLDSHRDGGQPWQCSFVELHTGRQTHRIV